MPIENTQLLRLRLKAGTHPLMAAIVAITLSAAASHVATTFQIQEGNGTNLTGAENDSLQVPSYGALAATNPFGTEKGRFS